jgi:hypothetical protein
LPRIEAAALSVSMPTTSRRLAAKQNAKILSIVNKFNY